MSAPVPAPASSPAPSRFNVVGLIALILGVIALLFAVVPVINFLTFIPAVAAIVLAIIGLVVKGKSRGLAIAGIILGALAWIVSIILFFVYAAMFVSQSNQTLPTPIPTTVTTDDSDLGGLGGISGSLQSGDSVTLDDGIEIWTTGWACSDGVCEVDVAAVTHGNGLQQFDLSNFSAVVGGATVAPDAKGSLLRGDAIDPSSDHPVEGKVVFDVPNGTVMLDEFDYTAADGQTVSVPMAQ